MPKIGSDLKALLPLEPYLLVLIDKYPDPIRPAELAQEVHYTKAAVTKVRSRLLELCDKDNMVFRRGFVLKSNLDVFIRSFVILAITGKHRQFIGSEFVRLLVKPEVIHSKLRAAIPFYENHFSEADTGYMIRKILEIVENVDSEELSQLAKAVLKQPSQFAGYALAFNLPRILSKMRFSIRDEYELQLLFVIRDKIFYLVRDVIWMMIEEMKILKELEEDRRDQYKSVFKHTVEFYLLQIMKTVDDNIKKAAAESGVKIGRSPPIGATPIVK